MNRFFESKEQAQELMKEWQNRLKLNDWTLFLEFCDDLDGNLGFCTPSVINRFATIQILSKDRAAWKNEHDSITQELCLVHEMLHCLFPGVERQGKTLEEHFYDEYIHQQVQRLAGALISAKYSS